LNNWHNAIIGHEFITYYLQDEAADQNEKNIAGSEIVKQSIFLVNIYSILFFKTLVSIVFEYLVSSHPNYLALKPEESFFLCSLIHSYIPDMFKLCRGSLWKLQKCL
jgi:hypothetical protein